MGGTFSPRHWFWPMTSPKGSKTPQKGQKGSKIVFLAIFRHFLHEKVPLRPLYRKLMETPFWPKKYFWPMTSRDDVIGPKRIKKGQKSCFLTFLSTFCMKKYPYDPYMECWWKTRFGPKITFGLWRHQKGQKVPKRVKKGLKRSKIMFFVIFKHVLHEKVPLWPLYGMLMENPFRAKNHFCHMTSSKGPKRPQKGQKRV